MDDIDTDLSPHALPRHMYTHVHTNTHMYDIDTGRMSKLHQQATCDGTKKSKSKNKK